MKYSHDDIATNGYTYVLPVVTNSGRGRHRPDQPDQHVVELRQRLRRLHRRSLEHLLLRVTYRFDAPPLPVAQMRMAEAPPAPKAPPPPPPPPPPAPPPQVQKITLDSKALFDFDKAVLKPEGKTAIDSQVVTKLAQMQKLEVVW